MVLVKSSGRWCSWGFRCPRSWFLVRSHRACSSDQGLQHGWGPRAPSLTSAQYPWCLRPGCPSGSCWRVCYRSRPVCIPIVWAWVMSTLCRFWISHMMYSLLSYCQACAPEAGISTMLSWPSSIFWHLRWYKCPTCHPWSRCRDTRQDPIGPCRFLCTWRSAESHGILGCPCSAIYWCRTACHSTWTHPSRTP